MASGCLRPSSWQKGYLFAPEGQISGNQRQIQETEKKGEGKRSKGERERIFVSEGQRTAFG